MSQMGCESQLISEVKPNRSVGGGGGGLQGKNVPKGCQEQISLAFVGQKVTTPCGVNLLELIF